jgi:sortase A
VHTSSSDPTGATGPVLPEWPEGMVPPPPAVARVDTNPWGVNYGSVMPDTGPWWKDWHAWLGGAGRTLIAVGLLLFAFVAYQLWGTGIEQARSQSELADRFGALQQQALAVTGPASTGTNPATSSATSSPATSSPATAAIATAVAPPTAPPTGLPPVATTIAPPVVEIAPGDPVARLRIPTLGVDQTIVSGVGRKDLEAGPGHFRTTPLPGQNGNAAVAGHRTTFGEPFRRLDELDTGDRIEVTDVFGRTYVYLVAEAFVVAPTDVKVLEDRGRPELTLVTCDPPFTADRRLIVRAVLDPAGSAVVAPVTLPATPATTAVPMTLPGGSDVATTAGGTTAGGTDGGSDAPVEAVPTGQSTPRPEDQAESADAFGQTWFADTGAWPGVIGWGLGLGVIGLSAWRISRRAGRNWVGALVAVAPFAATLYFFFQHVNRLLPAGF